MRTSVFFAALALLAAPAAAQADDAPAKVDADALIAACWAPHRAGIDGGVTAEMIVGLAAVSDCLKTRILETAAPLFAGTDYTADRQRADIDRMIAGAGTFQWKLRTENRFCAPACGTLERVLANHAIPPLLETLLRDVAGVRNGV